MKSRLLFVLILSVVLFTSCDRTKKDADSDKESATIYHNGDIITMEGDSPEYAEAVVQQNGKIVFVGSKDKAEKSYKGAEKFDLEGATMMPGFIEPHAHPVSIGAFILGNEIVAPHEWRMPYKTYPAATNHEEYISRLKKIVEENKEKDYVLTWGYHQAWHGPLTKEDLNAVSSTVPILIFHRSGHEYYLNDAAMRKFNVDVSKFENQDQMDAKNNHFWERGFQELRAGYLTPAVYGDKERLTLGMERMSEMMLQNGITAMMEPSFPNTEFHSEFNLLKAECERFPYYTMYLVPGFPEQFTLKKNNEEMHAYVQKMSEYNTDNIEFLTNQYKTFSDGAIYSLALQLKDGFANCPHCHAEWIMPPDMHKEVFDFFWDKGYKLHVHVTGDKGLQAALDILDKSMKRNPRENHQATMHHLGLFDEAQAQQMKALGAEASVNSYYLWALGNKYGEIGFGKERAARIAGMKWLTDRSIPMSLHSDFAMAPAEPLTLAWVAATRMTDSGQVLRPDLKITVWDAMRAITIDAAHTFSKDDEIGSIKRAKFATFTIIDKNPFKIEPMEIKDIKVKGIVYKGKFKENG